MRKFEWTSICGTYVLHPSFASLQALDLVLKPILDAHSLCHILLFPIKRCTNVRLTQKYGFIHIFLLFISNEWQWCSKIVSNFNIFNFPSRKILFFHDLWKLFKYPHTNYYHLSFLLYPIIGIQRLFKIKLVKICVIWAIGTIWFALGKPPYKSIVWTKHNCASSNFVQKSRIYVSKNLLPHLDQKPPNFKKLFRLQIYPSS